MTNTNLYIIDLLKADQNVHDSFNKMLYYYCGYDGKQWDKLELILKEKYHADVDHGEIRWNAVYFDSEEDLVAFKLKWL